MWGPQSLRHRIDKLGDSMWCRYEPKWPQNDDQMADEMVSSSGGRGGTHMLQEVQNPERACGGRKPNEALVLIAGFSLKSFR